MAKTVKIGFIGTGGIANYQMRTLVKTGGAEIAAIADINATALAKSQDEFKVKHAFTDWRKLVALKELDAVSVCTPNKLHCAPTIAALQAGKHVLVEKPMAMNAAEAAAMVKAARKSRKLLQIAFQYRFSPAAQLLRKEVASGRMGKVLYVRCQALRRRGIPSWGVFGRKELQGGGPMIDIGVHILECAHYIIGSPKAVSAKGACYTYLGNKPPAAKAAWGPWDYKTYNVEDLAVGMISFADGATLAIESSFAAHIKEDVFNIQIMGTAGGGTYAPPQLFRDENGYMLTSEPACIGNWNDFEYKMKHFVECIRFGRKCQAPGEDGLVVQQMLDGIYASAERGREVSIRAMA